MLVMSTLTKRLHRVSQFFVDHPWKYKRLPRTDRVCLPCSLGSQPLPVAGALPATMRPGFRPGQAGRVTPTHSSSSELMRDFCTHSSLFCWTNGQGPPRVLLSARNDFSSAYFFQIFLFFLFLFNFIYFPYIYLHYLQPMYIIII